MTDPKNEVKETPAGFNLFLIEMTKKESDATDPVVGRDFRYLLLDMDDNILGHGHTELEALQNVKENILTRFNSLKGTGRPNNLSSRPHPELERMFHKKRQALILEKLAEGKLDEIIKNSAIVKIKRYSGDMFSPELIEKSKTQHLTDPNRFTKEVTVSRTPVVTTW